MISKLLFNTKQLDVPLDIIVNLKDIKAFGKQENSTPLSNVLNSWKFSTLTTLLLIFTTSVINAQYTSCFTKHSTQFTQSSNTTIYTNEHTDSNAYNPTSSTMLNPTFNNISYISTTTTGVAQGSYVKVVLRLKRYSNTEKQIRVILGNQSKIINGITSSFSTFEVEFSNVQENPILRIESYGTQRVYIGLVRIDCSPYCIPTFKENSDTYITSAAFVGTQNDVTYTSTRSNNPAGYQSFDSNINIPAQYPGEAVNIDISIIRTSFIRAWIDFNNDKVFDTNINNNNEQIFNNSATSISSTTIGFIIPANQPPGNYRIRIVVSSNSSNLNPCSNSNNDGEVEDYILRILPKCPLDITGFTNGENCGPGSVVLKAFSNTQGTQEFKWYTSATGGTLVGTSNVQQIPTNGGTNYTTTFTTPVISQTTTFYVTASNSNCETNIRKPVIATIKEIPNISYLPQEPVACGYGEPIKLTAQESEEMVYLLDENFERGLDESTFNNEDIHVLNNNNTETQWKTQPSPYPATGSGNSWKPVISSGFGTNTFAYSTSDIGALGTGQRVEKALRMKNSIDTRGFQSLYLQFRIFFSSYRDNQETGTEEYVTVQVSENNGNFQPLANPVVYKQDEGKPGNFAIKTINLNQYRNKANLKFRFVYYANKWSDGVAIDDIQIFGNKTLTASFTWQGTGFNVFKDEQLQNPYISGQETEVFIVPDLNLLQNETFNITITTTLSNSCFLIQNIPVRSQTKVWNGSTNNNWSEPTNWRPVGVPNATHCVVIDSYTNNQNELDVNGNPIIKPLIDANNPVYSKNIQVKGYGKLVIPEGASIVVTDNVEVENTSILRLENNASLVQTTEVDNATSNKNKGKIEMIRKTTPIHRFDYVYWSSPVKEDRNVFLLGKNPDNLSIAGLSPETFFNKYHEYNPNTGWVNIDHGNAPMKAGKGYIVRAPQTSDHGVNGLNRNHYKAFEAKFIGIPNNGNITIPVTQGKWNLIGNPYPSAISLFDFFDKNDAFVETIYLWTHDSPTIFNNETSTFNYRNTDYIAANRVGTIDYRDREDGQLPLEIVSIAAGQSFMIKTKDVLPANPTAKFDNSMRIQTPNSNNTFFRPSNNNESVENWENVGRHRYFISVSNSAKDYNQTLVGYLPEASNDFDAKFDAEVNHNRVLSIYTMVNDKDLTIQGRSLPFNTQVVTPLGYKSNQSGNLTIKLDKFDGLFTNNNIYLEDTDLGVTHNLKESPYTFTTIAGTFNDRFKIKHLEETLQVDNEQFQSNKVIIHKIENEIAIKSHFNNIKEITIYDLQGITIYKQNTINSTNYKTQALSCNNQLIIVQVITDDNSKHTQKIIMD